MDGEDFDFHKLFKRRHPLADERSRRIRRLALLVYVVGLAYLLANLTGHDLPRPHEIWDGLIAVSQSIVRIPS